VAAQIAMPDRGRTSRVPGVASDVLTAARLEWLKQLRPAGRPCDGGVVVHQNGLGSRNLTPPLEVSSPGCADCRMRVRDRHDLDIAGNTEGNTDSDVAGRIARRLFGYLRSKAGTSACPTANVSES
jgi:hypothetical protein